MKVTIYSKDGITVVVGADAIDIETKNGLIGDPIPSEEWSTGFRFKESDSADD